MTAIPLRAYRRPLNLSGIKVGLEPTSAFWADVGETVNFLRGAGVQLVPAHFPGIELATGAETLRYRVLPSGRAVTRVWVVRIRSLDPPRAVATVSADGSTARTIVGSALIGDPGATAVIVANVAKASVATEITCTITQVEGTVIIDSVECWELPRAALTLDATDLGVDVRSLEPDRPIVDRDYESLGGIGVALAGADGRRGGLLSWWGPVCNFTAAASLFTTKVPIVPPKVGPFDGTRSIVWNAYVRVSAGATTGRVRVVDEAGNVSAWVSTSSTSYGWLEGTLSPLCEDLAEASGLPSGAWETVNFELERTAGAGTVQILGANVYDSAW